MLYSQLRNSPRIDLVAASPLRAPLTIYIDVTDACNFRCVQCPVGDENYRSTKTFLQRSVYERLIAEIGQLGRLKSLKLYLQGEPLLHPHIAEFVRMGKTVADRVEITSNGSVLSPEKAEALVRAGLDYLQVSVYGSSEEQHKHITQSAVSNERILANVRYLKHIRETLAVRNPFIFARFFKDTPANEAAFFAQWSPVADECGLDEIHDWDGQLNLRERFYQIAEPRPVSDLPCPFPFYTLTIKATGSVTVCCVDWSDAAEVGNIHHETLAEIWRGRRLHEFRLMHLKRQRHENEACRNCRIPDRPGTDDISRLTPEAFTQRFSLSDNLEP